MKIAVVGRGNVGGGLAKLWRDAGNDVTEIGRDGGDVSDADVVLLAVPSAAIAAAISAVSGIAGKTVIDATNQLQGERPAGFESLAAYVKSQTGGPVAKAFNLNFASLYDRLGAGEGRPSQLYAADEDARQVTEQLTREAGYEPVYAGGLDRARAIEDHLGLMFAVMQAGTGPFVYRIAQPEDL